VDAKGRSLRSTNPQSLAHALNDSPAGLAGWIVEKFRSWSDCGGDVESRFTKDELLTDIMIYWATESIGSSFLPYYDYANANALDWIKGGNETVDRLFQGAGGLRTLSEGYQSAAARMG
jgi:hypothetical protein